MAGKAMGCLLLGVLALAGTLYGGNRWAVSSIENGVRTSIFEETGHPPLIKGFTGVLPMGRFALDALHAKADVDSGLLELKTGSATVDLNPLGFLSERYEVRDLRIGLLQSHFHHPEWGGGLRANFKIDGSSNSPAPRDSPEGTLWIERLAVRADSFKAEMDGREWDLVHRVDFEVAPLHLVPEDGVAGTTEFDLRGAFTPSEAHDLFFARGSFDGAAARLRIDAGLFAIRFPTRLDWIDGQLLKDEGVKVADLIASGSMSYRLTGDLEGEVFKGRMTLRLLEPKFGPLLRDLARDASESLPVDLNLLLDAIENRPGAIEIGPLDLDENLATPELESAPLLFGGLTRELFKLTAGDGAGAAFNLFQRKDD